MLRLANVLFRTSRELLTASFKLAFRGKYTFEGRLLRFRRGDCTSYCLLTVSSFFKSRVFFLHNSYRSDVKSYTRR